MVTWLKNIFGHFSVVRRRRRRRRPSSSSSVVVVVVVRRRRRRRRRRPSSSVVGPYSDTCQSGQANLCEDASIDRKSSCRERV